MPWALEPSALPTPDTRRLENPLGVPASCGFEHNTRTKTKQNKQWSMLCCDTLHYLHAPSLPAHRGMLPELSIRHFAQKKSEPFQALLTYNTHGCSIRIAKHASKKSTQYIHKTNARHVKLLLFLFQHSLFVVFPFDC